MVGRCRTGFFFEVHAMKKTIFEHFGFWLRGVVCGALLLSAAVACSDDNDDPGAAAPEITLESVSTGQTEFSFRLRTNVDGAYGYQVVKRTQKMCIRDRALSVLKSMPIPTMPAGIFELPRISSGKMNARCR